VALVHEKQLFRSSRVARWFGAETTA